MDGCNGSRAPHKRAPTLMARKATRDHTSHIQKGLDCAALRCAAQLLNHNLRGSCLSLSKEASRSSNRGLSPLQFDGQASYAMYGGIHVHSRRPLDSDFKRGNKPRAASAVRLSLSLSLSLTHTRTHSQSLSRLPLFFLRDSEFKSRLPRSKLGKEERTQCTKEYPA